MEKNPEVDINQKQVSHTSCLVTTIRRLINRTNKDLIILILSFKRTQASAQHNRNILAAFDENLGKAVEAQQGITLDYGSEFQDLLGLKNVFRHHEDRYRILDIIQKGSRYHLSPIEEATKKFSFGVTINHTNHLLTHMRP